MRYINEEAKPFGLCSKEVQKAISSYLGKGGLEFYSNNDGWQYMKKVVQIFDATTYRAKIPSKTWREALSEKVKDKELLALVFERMGDEKLDVEFTDWEEWVFPDNSFDWGRTPESYDFWITFDNALRVEHDFPKVPKRKQAIKQKITDEDLIDLIDIRIEKHLTQLK